MHHKRTYKFRVVGGDARDIVASSRSLAEAAARLKVDKSTIFRWVKAGRVPAPGGKRQAQSERVQTMAAAPRFGGSQADPPKSPAPDVPWREWVSKTFNLSPSEARLADMTQAAMDVADDTSQPTPLRLAAMGRAQSLLRQLNLPEVASGNSQDKRPWTIV